MQRELLAEELSSYLYKYLSDNGDVAILRDRSSSSLPDEDRLIALVQQGITYQVLRSQYRQQYLFHLSTNARLHGRLSSDQPQSDAAILPESQLSTDSPPPSIAHTASSSPEHTLTPPKVKPHYPCVRRLQVDYVPVALPHVPLALLGGVDGARAGVLPGGGSHHDMMRCMTFVGMGGDSTRLTVVAGSDSGLVLWSSDEDLGSSYCFDDTAGHDISKNLMEPRKNEVHQDRLTAEHHLHELQAISGSVAPFVLQPKSRLCLRGDGDVFGHVSVVDNTSRWGGAGNPTTKIRDIACDEAGAILAVGLSDGGLVLQSVDRDDSQGGVMFGAQRGRVIAHEVKSRITYGTHA